MKEDAQQYSGSFGVFFKWGITIASWSLTVSELKLLYSKRFDWGPGITGFYLHDRNFEGGMEAGSWAYINQNTPLSAPRLLLDLQACPGLDIWGLAVCLHEQGIAQWECVGVRMLKYMTTHKQSDMDRSRKLNVLLTCTYLLSRKG